MNKVFLYIKPYLRWIILAGTVFFLVKAFNNNWQEVTAIQLDRSSFIILFVALLITIFAHIWASLVWGNILKSFQQPVQYRWIIPIYLKTNLAKYLPGNVWHYYGRISAVKKVGGSGEAATVSVLLEPLLMATAALIVAIIANSFGWLKTTNSLGILILQILSLSMICISVHPRILNPILKLANRLKGKTSPNFRLKHYPLLPLLGELIFLLLRGAGFLVTFAALTPVEPSQIPLLFSAFSLAWVVGLVIPAPGGLGVFETTALSLLNSDYSLGIILSVVALFRFISILAEVFGAGIGFLIDSYFKNLDLR